MQKLPFTVFGADCHPFSGQPSCDTAPGGIQLKFKICDEAQAAEKKVLEAGRNSRLPAMKV